MTLTEGSLERLEEARGEADASVYIAGCQWLDRYFAVSERQSTIATEVRAGIVTFLTMSYINLVNPKVLNASGVPLEHAASGTCIAAAVASLMVGVFGNLPVGCAPGVGLSAYFSYGLMAQIRDHMSPTSKFQAYEIGFSIQLLSGIVVLLLTLTRVIPFLVERLPDFIKLSTVVGMGVFLTFIGLLRAGIVVAGDFGDGNSEATTALTLGDLSDWMFWLALANVLLIGTLEIHRVNGSLLLGILGTSLVYWGVSDGWPLALMNAPLLADPMSTVGALSGMPWTPLLTAGVSFVLILVLDVSGVVFGVAKMAHLMHFDGRKQVVEGSDWAFVAASAGTIVAALMGCSPIIVHAESVAGVAAGGRTGITALTIALLFFLSTFFGPLFGSVPDIATAPCLVLVGVFMMKQVQLIEWSGADGRLRMAVAMPAFLTIVMMPFTYSIANGIFFGLGSYAVLSLTGGALFKSLARCCQKDSRRKQVMQQRLTLDSDSLPLVALSEESPRDYMSTAAVELE